MKGIKRLTRCEKGHFYDAGKYDVCPHCENTREISATRLEIEPEIQVKSTTSGKIPVDEVEDEVLKMVDKEENIVQPSALAEYVDKELNETADDDNLTVYYYQKTLGTNPVVGWLVCVKGVHFGQDFRIKSGRNFVGRSGTMDICLSGDIAVSRDRHLIVTYDPKGNTFFVQPGDTSSALSYLNDKPLLEATKIKTGDKLTLGESEMMFVAFCNEDFKWNN